jgi:hypothetical protein
MERWMEDTDKSIDDKFVQIAKELDAGRIDLSRARKKIQEMGVSRIKNFKN